MFANLERILMNPCGEFYPTCHNDVLSTDDETEERTVESKDTFESLDRDFVTREVTSPARSIKSTESKKVRFAMDDEATNRKRRNRNLRKCIIEKSRSSSEHNHGGSSRSSSSSSRRRRSIPLSPTSSGRKTTGSSPRAPPGRRHGRRRSLRF